MNSVSIRPRQLCHEEITEILECSAGPCISFFIVSGSEPQMQQDFDELLAQVKIDLEKFYTLDLEETEALLEPILTAAQNDEIGLLKQGGGLFVSQAEVYYYPGLQLLQSRAMVDDYFYVLPLFVKYAHYPCFPLLLITSDSIELYRVSQERKVQVPLPEKVDSNWFSQFKKEIQDKCQLVIFCQEQALCESWTETLSEKYPQLEIRHLQRKQPHQNLLALAWEKMAEWFYPEQLAAISEYQALSFTERILDDTSQLAQAAYNSRIETLFLIDQGRQDSSRGLLELINRAAIYTYMNEGNIYLAQPGELNGASLAAAILRY